MDDYIELHATSAFSFLRRGLTPENLVKTAFAQGVPSLAITDSMGIYGAVRAHVLAKENGIRAHVGTELLMEDNTVLPILAATRTGYQNLCRFTHGVEVAGGQRGGAGQLD